MHVYEVSRSHGGAYEDSGLVVRQIVTGEFLVSIFRIETAAEVRKMVTRWGHGGIFHT
jgi:hypothetical protein